MHKIFLLLITFLSLSKSCLPATRNTVAILIHGTWGLSSSWHQPGHIFYETLKNHLLQAKIKLINFNWSGKLCYDKRQAAGLNLANLIRSYPENTGFIIISHSHGGNVGIIASQNLTTSNQIEAFYSLGLPVDSQNYLPNMLVIKNFYHLFSFGDIHQTALGMHERVLPQKPRIYNVNIEIKKTKPQHEELHSAVIAKWLLQLAQGLKKLTSRSNHFFAIFNDTDLPVIGIDTKITEKLDYDQRWHARLHTSLLSPYSSGRSIINYSDSVTSPDKCSLPAN